MTKEIDPWALAQELEKDIHIMANHTAGDQACLALRRSYVRTVFSALEGILYMLREDIIHSGELDTLFTPKQRAKLLEKAYKKGVVQKHDKYLPLREAIKFVPECFAKHMGITDFKFPHQDEGWEQMQAAIEIRNNITHPKSNDALNISVKDLEIVVAAKVWFKDHVSSQLVVA
jgi:hypothetical protein